MNSTNTYKICLLGDGGVGKTTFVKRHLLHTFEKKYVATLGVEVHPVRKEGACFNLWDCAGQEKFGGLRDGYYIQSQGAMFFFSLDSKETLINLERWVRDFKRICGDVPVVFVGTKTDRADILEEEVREILGDVPFVEVSNKTGENIDEPLRILKGLLQ